MSNSNKVKAILLLEDGKIYSGVSGTPNAGKKSFGRVVFNTGMVGYQQLLTDPANHNLIVVQTFPLIGNYGINEQGNTERSAHVAGYVVRELCDEPSNYLCEGTLPCFLQENDVATIANVDTRSITRHIREAGEMKGVIATGDVDIEELKKELSSWKPTSYVADFCASAMGLIDGVTPSFNLAVLSLGGHTNVSRFFLQMGADVSVLSKDVSCENVISTKPDGVIISDGGGNPADFAKAIEAVRELSKTGIPMLGVGMGHLILALAMGGEVTELHCGHRGANQPVYRLENGRTYITTQNHGYIVCGDKLPANSQVSYKNSNDHSAEGINYPTINAQSVQFIPDTTTGIQSTRFIYEDFVAQVLARKGK